MTMDDLAGHSPNAGLIKCNSTNICATFSIGSTNAARRAVPYNAGPIVTNYISNLHKFLCMLPTAVVRSFSSDVRVTYLRIIMESSNVGDAKNVYSSDSIRR